MKKRFFAVLLVALLVLGTISALGESLRTLDVLEGTVLRQEAEGFLLDTVEFGEVWVHTDGETRWETDLPIAEGRYVFVDYDGKMTRSAPPQIVADTVRMYVLSGDVLSYDAAENAIRIDTVQHGEVLVWLGESAADAQQGDYVRVYFSGAMTMSLPGQISAAAVEWFYAQRGDVTDISGDFLMLGEGSEATEVHYAGDLPAGLRIGDMVLVLYNGQKTRSLPAQIFAQSIEKL